MWRKAAPLLLLISLLAIPPARPAEPANWEQWKSLPGVVDLGGPRSDGKLVATAGGQLFLIAADGTVAPFARGPGGYAVEAGGEPYLVVSPSLPSASQRCRFENDEVYVLALATPRGLTKVTLAGRATSFVTFPEIEFLSGIAFDTSGTFGNRLLVTGRGKGRNYVLAVDCLGKVTTITDAAPASEGGIVVAPASFGSFGGSLIVADEGSGNLFAVDPDGKSGMLVESGLPVGGDIGVESVGFLPEGFGRNGALYLADWGVPGNPHPGTDTVLRLHSEALTAAGARDTDLIAATEAGGKSISVRCTSTCSVIQVAHATEGAHAEGHIVAVAAIQRSGLAGRTPRPSGSIAVAVGLILITAALAVFLRRRARIDR